MIRVILDASALIEYLQGSGKGKEVEEHLARQDCFICSFTIGEVVSKTIRLGLDDAVVIKAIESHTKVIPMTFELSIEAGKAHARERKKKPNFSLGDAYIYATAKHIKAKILTSDHHFKDFKETILLK